MLARRGLPAWQIKERSVAIHDTVRVKKDQPYLFDCTDSFLACAKVVVMFFACLGIIGVLYGVKSATGYEVVHIRSNIVALNKTNEALRLDIAELKSPNRIQTIAEGKLGMVMPDQFIYSSERALAVEQAPSRVQPIVD